MLNPFAWLARIAQLFLLGLIGAFVVKIIPQFDAISANGAEGWTRIGLVVVPAIILLGMLGQRKTRFPATIITACIVAAVVWRLDDVLAYLEV